MRRRAPPATKEPTGQIRCRREWRGSTQQNLEISDCRRRPSATNKRCHQVLQQMIERPDGAGCERKCSVVIRYVTRERLREELLVSMYGKSADTISRPRASRSSFQNPGVSASVRPISSTRSHSICPAIPRFEGARSRQDDGRSRSLAQEKLQLRYSGQNSIDSGNVPTPIMKQILSLPAGKPFIFRRRARCRQCHHRTPGRARCHQRRRPDGGPDHAGRRTRQDDGGATKPKANISYQSRRPRNRLLKAPKPTS